MALATLRPRHLTRRAAATGLAALLLTGLSATSALAASSATVVLDPPVSGIRLDTSDLGDTAPRIPVGYGSTVILEVPPAGHVTFGAPVTASLVAWDSGTLRADFPSLPVTDLGGGRYEVDVPDTTAFGSTSPLDALLILEPLTTDIPGGLAGDARTRLDITDGGPATAEVDLAVDVSATMTGPEITSGTTVDVTVPAGSRLDLLGLSSLVGADLTFYSSTDYGESLAEPLTLPAPVLSADGRTATLAVPAGIPAGFYTVGLHAAPAGLFVNLNTVLTVVDPVVAAPVVAAPVVAAPVAPAPVAAAPVRNAGLRSATGWEDHVAAPADQSGTPWLALGGAAALLTAGAVTTATLRRRPTA